MLRTLIVVGLITGCGGHGGTPTTAATPRPTAPARPDPLTAPTDSTLALLEEVGRGCALRRVDPVAGTSIELARLPGPCLGARVSWRHDLRRALVWFDPETRHRAGFGANGYPAPGHPDEEPDEHAVARLYEIELASGAVRPLALPALPDPVAEFGYGKDDALLAFTVHDLPDAAHQTVSYLGHALDFRQLSEGMAAAAAVYRERATGWVLVDVVATTTGWDYAAEWHDLPAARDLGPRSIDLLEPHVAADEVDAAARPPLAALAPGATADDAWVRVATPAGPLYLWQVTAELTYTTGRIAWTTASGAIEAVPGLGFTGGELVAAQVRGHYLLVAGAGAGAFPRLYDLADRKLVFASDTARAATLWPIVAPAATAPPE